LSPEELGRGAGKTVADADEEPGLAVEKFFEEKAGKAAGVVADDAVFFEKIVEDHAEAELLKYGEIDGDRLGALRAIAAGHVGRHRLAIGDDPVDHTVRNVFLDGAEMIGKSVAGGFAGLGHQIGDVDARGFGFGDGAGDFGNEEIRENAGIERAGPEEDEISLFDRFDGLGKRAHAASGKAEFLDRGATGSDASFAVDDAAVFERGDQVNVRKCRREDAAADGEDFAANADGFGEVASDVGERGEKKIAEIVADETAARVEAVLKEAAKKGFIFRKCDHAVANVTGRKNAVFPADAAGAAAIIGDGDDRRQIGDRVFDGSVLVAAADDVFLEAAEKRGETRSTTESNDAEAAGERFRIGNAFFHDNASEKLCSIILQERIKQRERRRRRAEREPEGG
jgi:hypothetical protein